MYPLMQIIKLTLTRITNQTPQIKVVVTITKKFFYASPFRLFQGSNKAIFAISFGHFDESEGNFSWYFCPLFDFIKTEKAQKID